MNLRLISPTITATRTTRRLCVSRRRGYQVTRLRSGVQLRVKFRRYRGWVSCAKEWCLACAAGLGLAAAAYVRLSVACDTWRRLSLLPALLWRCCCGAASEGWRAAQRLLGDIGASGVSMFVLFTFRWKSARCAPISRPRTRRPPRPTWACWPSRRRAGLLAPDGAVPPPDRSRVRQND